MENVERNKMKDAREKFIVLVSEERMTISDMSGQCLTLEPVEALMLLDILKAEESQLRELADAQSPLPMRFSF